MSFWNDEVIRDADNNTGGGFEPIPAANYTLILVDSEMKETKQGTGHYINVQFEVVAPAFAGRKLFAKYNIDNPSPEAVSIGLGQLKALCNACNKPNWYEELKTCPSLDKVKTHVDTLHATLNNIPFIARITIKNDPVYGAQNVITNTKACEGAAVPAPKQQSAVNKKSTPFD